MSGTSENNKRIAKNTMLLYFRMIFIMIISIFTSRINLQSLGVENFGIYNVVGGVVAMFSVFSGSLGVSISRFITFELGKENKERLQKVFSTAVSIQMLLAVGITILAEIVGIWFLNNKMNIPEERLDAANWVMHLSIITFAVNLISVPYNAAIIAHEKMSAFAYVSVFEVVAKLGITYYLFISPFDKLKTFAVLLFVLSIILRLIYGVYCKRHFQECSYRFIMNKALFKEMVGFAGWSMFGLVAHTGYNYGLNILLNLFFGPVVNAARGIAFQVQQAVQGFSNNFQMALNPQIIKSYAQKDLKRMHELVFASSKYSFFLLYFLSLPIIIETPTILSLWLVDVPPHTANFIRLMLALITFDSLGGPISIAQQATGKIKTYQIWVGGIMLMIVPVAYLCLKLGTSPESVYYVYFTACVVAHCVRMIIIRPLIELSLREYFKKVILRLMYVLLTSALLPILIYNVLPETVTSFIIICVLCVCMVAVCVYVFGLERNEREIVNKQIQEGILKMKSRLI
ncbi:MAG: oligosaccharide flippase family protein [Bacteroidaceae bacterium]|nr:oligosaccharide flippase family protein [Bacteroidaceae bacterium]